MKKKDYRLGKILNKCGFLMAAGYIALFVLFFIEPFFCFILFLIMSYLTAELYKYVKYKKNIEPNSDI